MKIAESISGGEFLEKNIFGVISGAIFEGIVVKKIVQKIPGGISS